MRRGRRRFLLVLLVAVLAPLAGRAVDSRPSDPLNAQLERIFAKKEFEAKKFGPARWMDEGRSYTTVEASATVPEARDIVRYDTATGARLVLVAAASLVPTIGQKPLDIDDYQWSKGGSRLLLFTNTKKVWRQNTRGDYWVLDVRSGTLRKIGGAAASESSLQFAKFSPDGTRVAYVRGNDLWVEDIAAGNLTRLTADGSATIVNGTSDWVYEEEFGLRDAFRWSPDGKDIAFWRFDTSGVGDFALINDTDTTYPVVTRIPYPTAGTTNPAVKIGIVASSGGTPRWVGLPGDPRDHYVPRMEWAEGPTEILLQRLNRLQNRNEVWLADPRTGAARNVFSDTDAAWVDVVDSWQWLPGNKELLWVSERDGWRHAWAVPRSGKGAARLLTPGPFDILNVDSLDEKKGFLYFIASPDDATRRYLYRTRLTGAGAPERVTPVELPGTHAYDISPDAGFAFHTRSRIDRPPEIDLVRLPSHAFVRALEANAPLASAVASIAATPTEFFRVDIGDGVALDGWMIRPRDFDPSRKYPLLMYVYGEPAGAEVTDSWHGNRYLFHRALADAGFVVACFDNRGTPAPRGRAWRKVVYGSVGVLASREQAAAVRKLLAERPYLDGERVASWGWSGGGSMTLNLLFRSPELYRVGMAVAPVPDQTLYDSIYQERYMGLPQDNPEGYRNGSPITFAEGLSGHLLVVHGSGDDNVHFQGSERLVNRMISLGKRFDFMDYPNRTHSISEGDGTSVHVHRLLARYLIEHLEPGAHPQ